ncbi:MAG TPA: glycine cleavage system aminomethyltransferase GcvT [bacterium]|nr:glycine cleavage system aminomethyltransferase GcvT [bacterium]
MSDTAAPTIKKTALNDAHRKLGARMVEFGGYDMPVWYSSIIREHTATRTQAGLFDLSHMGELYFRGPHAEAELQRLTANNVNKLGIGDAQYSFLPNDRGGIVDDIVLYRLGEDAYLMVVNAANIAKDVAWLQSQMREPELMVDRSDEMSLLALQGPEAGNILTKILPDPEAALGLKFYTFTTERIPHREGHLIISRTGYTGEDGFELYIPNELAEEWWWKILEAGRGVVEPCGLGARDTLRLELCYPLYGHEITDETNPFEANLGWVTKLQKGEFLGSEILQRIKQEGLTRKLAGLFPEGKRPIRQGAKVYVEGAESGFVTSGSFSPTLERNIALAYVPIDKAGVGSTVQVEVGNERVDAAVVETPFVKQWSKR